VPTRVAGKATPATIRHGFLRQSSRSLPVDTPRTPLLRRPVRPADSPRAVARCPAMRGTVGMWGRDDRDGRQGPGLAAHRGGQRLRAAPHRTGRTDPSALGPKISLAAAESLAKEPEPSSWAFESWLDGREEYPVGGGSRFARPALSVRTPQSVAPSGPSPMPWWTGTNCASASPTSCTGSPSRCTTGCGRTPTSSSAGPPSPTPDRTARRWNCCAPTWPPGRCSPAMDGG
jgi:hypothetical protein